MEPTPEEIKKKLREMSTRKSKAEADLVAPARGAVYALKDAGLTNSALAIEAVLFQLDALEQEAMDLINSYPGPTVLAMKLMMSKSGKYNL